MADDILYSIRNLTVEYNTRAGPVRAVDNVSLDIRRGEILGLVGEFWLWKIHPGQGADAPAHRPGSDCRR